MGPLNEKQLAKLIKKTAEKAAKKPADKKRQYDPTLRTSKETDDDPDRQAFFSEMKKREF
jgi:hypothetical protein